jgi:subtilisin family serine protease
LIDVCAGHGTFIAGIIRRICPDAEIHVDGVLSSFGDGDDGTLEEGVTRALARVAPAEFDVVVMSLGCYTSDDRFPPLAAVVRRLAAGPRTVVVASAGNNASARPYFPASIPEVIAVGALDASRRAWFSNFGGWVDACAPGVDVVSTYFCDADDVGDGIATRYQGWAAWNGTSFAAPKVAAAIAQDLYLHGGSAKDAWKRLTTHRHARVPDLGVVFDLV